MKRILSLMLVATAVLMVSTLPASATLVTNGGFETGDFTGWAHEGFITYDYISDVLVEPYYVHSGNHGAGLGAVSETFLYQDLVTIPGQTYSISFWLPNYTSGYTPDNYFIAYWDDTSNKLFNGQDLVNSAYTEHTYLQVASSTTTQFGFSYTNLPGYFALDDISVVPAVAPVPVPSTLLLLGSGLVGLLGYGRKRLKK